EWSLQDDDELPTRAATPCDIALGELAEVKQQLQDRCATVGADELVDRLMSAFAAAEFLKPTRTPDSFRERLAQLGSRLMKLERRGRLLFPEDIREVLSQVARTVVPLFCGGGDKPLQFLFGPP